MHSMHRMAMMMTTTTTTTTAAASAPSQKELRVICAGLGRTGTFSLTEALEILGYKPYHFIHPSHAQQWALVAQGEASVDTVVDAIVDNDYDSVLDNPCCDFYLDMLKRYPKGKVILTVRDSPEKFETSWKMLFDTMVLTEQPFSWTFPSFFGWIPLFSNLKSIRYMMGTTHLELPPGALTHGWRDQKDGWLGEQYLRHNAHVQRNVPSDQLLVFNVKEGWKPLCDFLECEIPSCPFPHSKTNDTKALKKLKRTFQIVVYSWIPVTVGVVAGALLYGRRCRGGFASQPREL